MLKEGGKQAAAGAGRRRAHNVLIVVECALAVVLLVGAGLFFRSFLNLKQVNPGFVAENLLTMRIDLVRGRYTQPGSSAAFFDQLQQRVAALPGVEAVGMVTELPLRDQRNDGHFEIAGRPPQQSPAQRLAADYRRINHDYLRAMQIPLLRGRYPTEQEVRQDAHVVVISEQLARNEFPNEDPVGKGLLLKYLDDKPFDIIGVAGDVRHRALEIGVYQTIYHPTLQTGWMNLVVRTQGDTGSLATAVRQTIRAIDPNQPVANVKPMEQWLGESVAQPRFRTSLLSLFAALALLLAVLGIYGVLAYSVAQRTHEIGIRLALGAQRADVLRLVVKQGMLLTMLGIGLGLAVAYGLGRLLTGVTSMLYGVQSTDKLTFGLVAALLTTVALLACWIPARRAARVDPTVALRCE